MGKVPRITSGGYTGGDKRFPHVGIAQSGTSRVRPEDIPLTSKVVITFSHKSIIVTLMDNTPDTKMVSSHITAKSDQKTYDDRVSHLQEKILCLLMQPENYHNKSRKFELSLLKEDALEILRSFDKKYKEYFSRLHLGYFEEDKDVLEDPAEEGNSILTLDAENYEQYRYGGEFILTEHQAKVQKLFSAKFIDLFIRKNIRYWVLIPYVFDHIDKIVTDLDESSVTTITEKIAIINQALDQEEKTFTKGTYKAFLETVFLFWNWVNDDYQNLIDYNHSKLRLLDVQSIQKNIFRDTDNQSNMIAFKELVRDTDVSILQKLFDIYKDIFKLPHVTIEEFIDQSVYPDIS